MRFSSPTNTQKFSGVSAPARYVLLALTAEGINNIFHVNIEEFEPEVNKNLFFLSVSLSLSLSLLLRFYVFGLFPPCVRRKLYAPAEEWT